MDKSDEMSKVALREKVRAALPNGNLLSDEAWVSRHRAILIILWLHVPFLVAVGTLTKHGLGHSILEAGIVALLAAAATRKTLSHSFRSSFATLGLVVSSAILVHFSGGLIEMHFHFFVVVAIVTLYQAWTPFLLAIAFVVIHHGTVGVFQSLDVYNHAPAVANPWKWALIHGLFIAAESAAGLTAWKMNELSLERERSTSRKFQTVNTELAAAQSMASIGSWDWNIDVGTVWWSEELYRIFGVSPDEFTPSLEAYMERIKPDDRSRIRKEIEAAFNDDKGFDYETQIVHPNGTIRTIQALGKRSLDSDGNVKRMTGTVQDITERKFLEDRVEYQAFHDSLTGLANRALFLDRVEHALARRTGTSSAVAVIFIDIDDFKTVNDSLGHSSGDELLIQLGKRIQALLRPADTLARLGGDEFAILLEDLTDERQAPEVAKRLINVLATPFSLPEGNEIVIRASSGIALSVLDDPPIPDELMRRADTAMYAAKRHGKGSFEVFQEGMDEAAILRLRMKADLEAAIANNEFILNYQPIVEAGTGEIRGVEALVRWIHPERGLISPLDFIPFAEETGLILPLTRWVLREACSRGASWVGLDGKPISIAVNISAVRFLHPGLEKELTQVLQETGLAAERLTLEITESILVHDAADVTQRLHELKKLGVQVAVDDFGTGYSSLSYLRDFPIDLLKVDKSFIDSIATGPEESALARAIIRLGKTLGLRVVAEGVETQDQADILGELECEYAQGYLFSRPVDAGSIDALLEAQRIAPRRTLTDAI